MLKVGSTGITLTRGHSTEVKTTETCTVNRCKRIHTTPGLENVLRTTIYSTAIHIKALYHERAPTPPDLTDGMRDRPDRPSDREGNSDRLIDEALRQQQKGNRARGFAPCAASTQSTVGNYNQSALYVGLHHNEIAFYRYNTSRNSRSQMLPDH